MVDRVECGKCTAHWDRSKHFVCPVCAYPHAIDVPPTLIDVDAAIVRKEAELLKLRSGRQQLARDLAARGGQETRH
jgi:hypothetical protein